MCEQIVAQYSNEPGLQYFWKANPDAFQLSYWKDHFEGAFLRQWAPRSAWVFDFGCGIGCLDILLAQDGYKVFGYDNQRGSVAIARHLAATTGTVVDFYDELPDRPYDRIWMCHVLEHIPLVDFGEVFSKLASVPILISVPFGDGYGSHGHDHPWWSVQELSDAIAPYVTITWITHVEKYSVLRAEVIPNVKTLS